MDQELKHYLEAMESRMVTLMTEVKESLERQINPGFEDVATRNTRHQARPAGRADSNRQPVDQSHERLGALDKKIRRSPSCGTKW